MNDQIERNRAAVQQTTQEAQQAALRALDRYVANRQSTLSSFERMDSQSRQTQDAKALLEAALSDREAFKASIGETG